VPTLDQIQEMIRNTTGMLKEEKRLKEKLDKMQVLTLDEAIAVGAANGAQRLERGGVIGRIVGRVTGGTGAFVAGQYKKTCTKKTLK
jgi:predicted nucleic acid-binding protein